MSVREAIKDLKHSKFLGGRLLYRFFRQCRIGIDVLSNRRFRAETLTRLRFRNRSHQRSTYTSANRYPLVFKACAEYLSSIAPPARLLSFGCSTGEEVATLGHYFPNAAIVGVDINDWSLRQCRKNYKEQRFSFLQRQSQALAAAENFDAIFSMAVFQRTENRTNPENSTAQGFLFEQFAAEIAILHKKLKPGGLFVIDHADFSFMDTGCAKHYTPLPFINNRLRRERPAFDRNNLKIAESQYYYRVFVKS